MVEFSILKRSHITALIVIGIVSISCSNKTKNQVNKYLNDDSQITFEKFHPYAQQILTEEFYWSPIEETGPFGSDAGSDAFYGFRKWRRQNRDKSPVEYLDKLIAEWNFKKSFDYNELNDSLINKYISEYPIGDMVLIEIDNAIIAIGFGQYVIEGMIDNDILELTKIAIERELKPTLIELFRSDYQDTRRQRLTKMKSVITKMRKKGSS